MRIVFIGTGEIGVPVLKWLVGSEHQLVGVVTQPDKPAGRAQTLNPPPIKLALVDRKIPLAQPARIKTEESIAQIRQWSPDVIVVMAYGQILPCSVLEIPRVACLNLHASLLPRHRGAAPIQAAILAGDRESGITIMYMDEGLDTGDILLESRLAISPNETGGSLHDRLAEIAPAALEQALILLKNGDAPRTAQDSGAATYAAKLERADGRIDWTKPAVAIERRIRAFDPWPGAFATLRAAAHTERVLKIFRAQVSPKVGRPGDILVRTRDELIIATGEGSLSLGEVQLAGKRRLPIAEFLRGLPDAITLA